MVPWFSERELTSSFLGEDVEVGVVAWWYELFGSAHGFLDDRHLNLGLMNKLQAFSLNLLIKDSELFCSVLEQVTGTGASGEFHSS